MIQIQLKKMNQLTPILENACQILQALGHDNENGDGNGNVNIINVHIVSTSLFVYNPYLIVSALLVDQKR